MNKKEGVYLQLDKNNRLIGVVILGIGLLIAIMAIMTMYNDMKIDSLFEVYYTYESPLTGHEKFVEILIMLGMGMIVYGLAWIGKTAVTYCENCKAEMSKQDTSCPQCGVTQSETLKKPDSSGFLWALLGFFLLPLNVILYLMWCNTRPNRSKTIGKGMLVYLVATILIILFFE